MSAITLIDSPVANVANIARALRKVGADLCTSADAEEIARSPRIVLPGVGSFRAAMRWLGERGIDDALRDAVSRGARLLGICVGHQVLFEASEEMGSTLGLGFLRGTVRRIDSTLPVPQIGWNRIRFGESALFEGIQRGSAFYFVHSYAAANVESEIASAQYGVEFTAAAQQGNVMGLQFHPEKSSTAGLRVLRNFVGS